MTVFHFHCPVRMGDNLLNLKYLLFLSKHLKEMNYTIYYYYDKKYTFGDEQIMPYVDPDVIQLRPINEVPTHSIGLWMAHTLNGITNNDNFELYYHHFYSNMLYYLNLDRTAFSTSLWIDEPFLQNTYETLDSKYKDIDILILNNTSYSGLYKDNTQFIGLAKHLHQRFNIVTVQPVDSDITSTVGLSVRDIGAISTHSKYIIAVFSGPMVACFNKQAKESVKKWFFVTAGERVKFDSIDYEHVITDLTPIKLYFDSI
jgi:hypothetical protein